MHSHALSGEVIWKSPANIALVKYWGKKNKQIPLNPSISLTLAKSCTTMHICYNVRKSEDPLLKKFLFLGKKNIFFEKKVYEFIHQILPIFPFLHNFTLSINTVNNFPHSAGIASSAASMSALALCICTLEKKIQGNNTPQEKDFYRKASFIARLGSGSACRSIFGGISIWGNTPLYKGSSNTHAIPFVDVHATFQDLCDTILIVDAKKKRISSTEGHFLMNTHPFKAQKIAISENNLEKMIKILTTGDVDGFIHVVEQEALLLHAMMLTSNPYYILLHPNSLAIIQRIISFRTEKKLFVCFTIDAGPNIHMIYPTSIAPVIKKFVEEEIAFFCEKKHVIFDKIGCGPKKILLQ